MRPSSRHTYRRLAGAGVSNTSFFVAQSLAFVVLTPITLRTLGPEVYGLWTIILALFGFSNLAQFGVDAAVAKYTAEHAISANARRFSAALTVSYLFALSSALVVATTVFLLRDSLTSTLAPSATVAASVPTMFGLVSIAIIPAFLFSASRGILVGLMENTVVNAIDVGTNIAAWTGAILVGSLGGSVLLLGGVMVAINLTRFLLGALLAFRAVSAVELRPTLDAAVTAEVVSFALSSWAISVGLLLSQSADKLVVGVMLGPVAAGVYGIATGVAARVYAVAARVTQALMPFASAQAHIGRLDVVVSVFRVSNRLVSGGVLMTAGVLMIWMDVVLTLWISPEFGSQYVSLFRIVLLLYAVSGLGLPGQQIAQGIGRLSGPAVLSIVAGVGVNASLWFCCRTWGLSAAGWANLPSLAAVGTPVWLCGRLAVPRATLLTDIGPALGWFAVAVVAALAFSTEPARYVSSGVLVIALSVALLRQNLPVAKRLLNG